ncbi:hypothetical protein ADL26_16635, partial [Thermoactinomyces vulgaris]
FKGACLTAARGGLHTGDLHGGGDVLEGGHVGEEVVLLEDRGGVLVAVAAQADRVQVLSVEADDALGGGVESARQGQQRGLTAAGRAKDRVEGAALEAVVDALEDGAPAALTGVGVADAVEAQD